MISPFDIFFTFSGFRYVGITFIDFMSFSRYIFRAETCLCWNVLGISNFKRIYNAKYFFVSVLQLEKTEFFL